MTCAGVQGLGPRGAVARGGAQALKRVGGGVEGGECHDGDTYQMPEWPRVSEAGLRGWAGFGS